MMLTGVVSADMVTEKPRELNKVRYFYLDKIKHPIQSFVASIKGNEKEVFINQIREKQQMLEEVDYLEDKEEPLKRLKKRIDDYELTHVESAGLEMVKQELENDLQEINDAVDEEEFLKNFATNIKERETEEYLSYAKDVFNGEINLLLPEKEYTLFFEDGRFIRYEEDASSTAQYNIVLSNTQIARLNQALINKQWNKFDDTLKDALPTDLKLKISDVLTERYGNSIKEKFRRD